MKAYVLHRTQDSLSKTKRINWRILEKLEVFGNNKPPIREGFGKSKSICYLSGRVP